MTDDAVHEIAAGRRDQHGLPGRLQGPLPRRAADVAGGLRYEAATSHEIDDTEERVAAFR